MKPENNTCQASRGFVPSALYSLQKKMKPSLHVREKCQFLTMGIKPLFIGKTITKFGAYTVRQQLKKSGNWPLNPKPEDSSI